MRVGEMLVSRGLVAAQDMEAALRRQQVKGGRLHDNLVAMGLLSVAELTAVMDTAPVVPSALNETGVLERNLLSLMLKFMLLGSCETVMGLADRMKLPSRIISQLLDEATQQRFVQSMGAASGGLALSIRYTLSDQGRAAAKDALEHSMYVGPAPVDLTAYQQQIEKQRITNEMVDEDAVRRSFEDLVVPDGCVRRLLPAVSAGRSLLLFGPSGNGKTTLAMRMGAIFKDVVYIPYAVEIGGQIMTVFDPRLHKAVVAEDASPAPSAFGGLPRSTFDQRWVPCLRPMVVAGGEFTLEKLELRHSSDAKFYDAPLHVKALNGVFLLDDFGRQKFSPDTLLNRWIVPMESQIDYLTLNTGASFALPFDVFLIFSTNLNPSDLMDPAFLRRIQYKIKLFSPTVDEYWKIFDSIAAAHGLELTDDVFEYVIGRLRQPGLAYYQPKFICEHVVEACRCLKLPPELTEELAAEALANLYYDIEDAREAEPEFAQ
jgi:hypothetical protein